MKNIKFLKHLALMGLICYGSSLTANQEYKFDLPRYKPDLKDLSYADKFKLFSEGFMFIATVAYIRSLIWPSDSNAAGANANIGDVAVPTTTFNDVIGAQAAKEALSDVVEMLKNPQPYLDIGVQLPKGILLEGGPGTGKTLLAKALAGEAHVSFLAVNGASFADKYIGVGVSRVKKLFEKARASAPCIIFIDEIDGLGNRGSFGDGKVASELNRIITEFLTQMDGIQTDPKKPIIVIGATNHKELIDPAILRSGRFDRIVKVGNPTAADRKAIMKLYANKIKTDAAIDFDILTQKSVDFSGADLANLVNQAGLIAVRRKAKVVQQIDFDRALEELLESTK
jgi:cell division protease FtsH